MTAKTASETLAKIPCRICYSKIDPRAKKCVTCDTWLAKETPCVVCKNPISEKEKRCPVCKARQWRLPHYLAGFQVFMSLLVALFAIIGGIYSSLAERHSQTDFKLTSSNAGTLYLKAWNTGRAPSKLLSYSLEFPETLHLVNAALKLDETSATEARNVVVRGDPAIIGLVVRNAVLTTPKPDGNGFYSEDEIVALLDGTEKGAPVTLHICVEESGRIWDVFTKRPFIELSDSVAAGDLRTFIRAGIPDIPAPGREASGGATNAFQCP